MACGMLFKIFLCTVIFVASNVHAAWRFTGKVSYVTDGDTLWVQPDVGGPPRKLRIDGIDAPEICQAGGEASRALLMQRALHQRVLVTVRRRDIYGRGLAHIQLNGHDIGAMMVSTGQAWSYRWGQNPGPYAEEEAFARQFRQGLFATSQPVMPRVFRKRHGSCYASQ